MPSSEILFEMIGEEKGPLIGFMLFSRKPSPNDLFSRLLGALAEGRMNIWLAGGRIHFSCQELGLCNLSYSLIPHEEELLADLIRTDNQIVCRRAKDGEDGFLAIGPPSMFSDQDRFPFLFLPA